MDINIGDTLRIKWKGEGSSIKPKWDGKVVIIKAIYADNRKYPYSINDCPYTWQKEDFISNMIWI